jgi:hypothetical protein
MYHTIANSQSVFFPETGHQQQSQLFPNAAQKYRADTRNTEKSITFKRSVVTMLAGKGGKRYNVQQ